LRSLDIGAHAQEPGNVVLFGQVLPVLQNLCSLGELLGPLQIGGEGSLVDMRWNVASDTWVNIIKPGSALSMTMSVLLTHVEKEVTE
jgi:hypothetical protein